MLRGAWFPTEFAHIYEYTYKLTYTDTQRDRVADAHRNRLLFGEIHFESDRNAIVVAYCDPECHRNKDFNRNPDFNKVIDCDQNRDKDSVAFRERFDQRKHQCECLAELLCLPVRQLDWVAL